jgi:DNA-binding NarL/FixJ family response regulator
MAQITFLSLGPLSHALPQARALADQGDFRILEGDGSFSTLDDILSNNRVDVILARVNGLNSLQGIRNVIRGGRNRKVIITGVSNWDVILEYIRAGIKGHLDASISPELLTKAIRVIHKGEVWFPRQTASKILEAFAGLRDQRVISCLTNREREILQLVARGLRNRGIAESLHISETTVKTHLYHIYEKLGVEDRLAAALLMRRAEGHEQ